MDSKPTHRQLQMLRSLRTRKGRDEEGLFLVEGRRLLEELLTAGLRVPFVLWPGQGQADAQAARLVGEFRRKGAHVLEAPAREIERVSDTEQSQGLVAAAQWKDHSLEQLHLPGRGILLALDRISDPGNVGTIIRTAAWFGAAGVLLGEGCADLLNPKTVRATMGGLFHLPVYRDVALAPAITALRAKGFRVSATVMDGDTNWQDWASAPRSLAILGSEAHGISPDLLRLADRRITIPPRGKGESLNVAVCAGVLMAVAG